MCRSDSVHRARAGDLGTGSVEYLGVIFLVGAILAALTVSGIAGRVAADICNEVAKVATGGACATVPAGQTTSPGGLGSPIPPLDMEGYWRRLCQDLVLDCEGWDPNRGLSCNDDRIRRVYEYYADLFKRHPELQWAGMAKLAGGLVYAGMQDLHVLRKLSHDARVHFLRQLPIQLPDFLIAALADASEWELKHFEVQFVDMQKQIFRDLGWQHAAYDKGGIAEMRRLYAAQQLTPEMLDAWEDIASGDPARIKAGNKALLYREQKTVLQDDYDDMKNFQRPLGLAVTYLLGLTGESPVPGGRPFRDVIDEVHINLPDQICVPITGPCINTPDEAVLQSPVPTGNIATFDTRWKWITEDMLPRYQWLLDNDPEQLRRAIAQPLPERAQQYRLVPIGYDPEDGLC
ncbi:DUF2515 family protein [Actinomadura scrupuli]